MSLCEICGKKSDSLHIFWNLVMHKMCADCVNKAASRGLTKLEYYKAMVSRSSFHAI